jgi:hypothetical protein
MKNWLILLWGELMRLWKYKILLFGFLVSLIWVLIVSLVNRTEALSLMPMLLVLDTGMMVILLLASSYYFEKQEGTIKTLFVTPIHAMQLLSAKIASTFVSGLISMTLIGLAVWLIHGIDTIQVCADKGVMDGASLKLIKLGGMLPGMQAAIELEKRDLNLNLACKVAETSLSAAATASIGFAMNGASWGLSMSNAYLEYDICDTPLTAAEGKLNIEQLNSVGIGVVPNLALVKKTVSSEWGIIEC